MSSEEGSGGGTGGTEAREHLANERTLLAWVRTGQFLRSRREISAGTFVSAATAYMVIVAGSLALAGVFVIYVVLTGF